jgi:putative lipoprotein (rSAM/lipoprotein system)
MIASLKKGWRWLLGALLTLLGFSGCDRIGLFRVEYGSPHSDYKLVGEVKDKTGKPIEGIRVVFDFNPEYQGEYKVNDTLYTDAKGHFEKERVSDIYWNTAAITKFEDVDGAEHGSFKTKILTNDEMVMEQTQKGDGHWYGGVYTVHADAVLEEEY